MLTTTDAGVVVRRLITDLLEEDSDGAPVAFVGTDSLIDIGLGSLLLARLILQLEMEFGVDPFAHEDLVVGDVRTVDELVAVYAAAAAQGTQP